jgi:hypothetical protein
MKDSPRFALPMSLIALGVLAGFAIFFSQVRAAEAPVAKKPKSDARAIGDAERGAKERFSFADLLPTAWQKRPKVRFNVYTEMTPEGRSRPEPSPAKPLTYFAPAGKYVESGWQITPGEKPPPWEQLREAMKKALAGNGYNPIADDRQRPDLLIVFSYGSFSTDIAVLAVDPERPPYEPLIPPPVTAEELLPWLVVKPPANPFYDRNAAIDVVERARFIGGAKLAEELKTALRFEATYDGPPEGSPVAVLLHGAGGEKMREVLELAFHTCYFVTATAFDFSGVEKKQKQLLWQTRMTIEAQGVSMEEILKPLIINTGAYLGRETPETVTIGKRINRDGRVDVGTPTVVPEAPVRPTEPKK